MLGAGGAALTATAAAALPAMHQLMAGMPAVNKTRRDGDASPLIAYMSKVMRAFLWTVPLLLLLALALWFAADAWVRFGGEPIPTYGYAAIAGGVLFSLAVGGGLMALVFYSHRHGYDEGHDRGRER